MGKLSLPLNQQAQTWNLLCERAKKRQKEDKGFPKGYLVLEINTNAAPRGATPVAGAMVQAGG